MTFYIHEVDFEEDIEGFLAQRGIIVRNIHTTQDADYGMLPEIKIIIEGTIISKGE